MPPYVFKLKTKQKRNTRLHDRNRKKCKSNLQAQKKSTIKIKFLYFSL